MELTSGAGVGRICDCSGNATMINNCFSYLRKGGQVVLIGLPKQPIHIENPLPDMCTYRLFIYLNHGIYFTTLIAIVFSVIDSFRMT